jgi:hypothetical protein
LLNNHYIIGLAGNGGTSIIGNAIDGINVNTHNP